MSPSVSSAEQRAPREAAASSRLLDAKAVEVTFRMGDRLVRAVDSVDLHVNGGECVGLVGESGSGKSMLARALTRLRPNVDLERFSGQVWFDGIDIAAMSEAMLRDLRRRRSLSVVFQDPLKYLNPTKRVGPQIAEALPEKLPRGARAARVDDLLTQAGLPRGAGIGHRYPHELSGGMRQRVLIALALASEPRLLIADEPTTGLDVTVQKQVLGTLNRLHQESGMAMLVISHDLALIAELCDRVYVMYAGQVVEASDVYSLFDSPAHPYSMGLLESIPKIGSGALPQAMRGGVPDLSDLPGGCRFLPRCDFAEDQCADEQALRLLRSDVEARCWKAETIAGNPGVPESSMGRQ